MNKAEEIYRRILEERMNLMHQNSHCRLNDMAYTRYMYVKEKALKKLWNYMLSNNILTENIVMHTQDMWFDPSDKNYSKPLKEILRDTRDMQDYYADKEANYEC